MASFLQRKSTMSYWIMQGLCSSWLYSASYICSITSLRRPVFRLPSILPSLRIFTHAARIARVEHRTIIFAISLSVITSAPYNLLMIMFSSSVRWIFDSLGAILRRWNVEVCDESQTVGNGLDCWRNGGGTIFRYTLYQCCAKEYTVWIFINNTVWVHL